MQLLIATTNPGKVQEYKWIFREWDGLKLSTPEDFDINDEPEENGNDFSKNALIKADFYCKKVGLPVLADDSGLEIDALDGEPGIRSRRWLGYRGDDKELIDYCLLRMKGVPAEKRGAQFRVVTVVRFPDGSVLQGEGMHRGFIADKVMYKLIPGFPFRSIFIKDEDEKSDNSYMWKGQYSHRKMAISQITTELWKKLN